MLVINLSSEDEDAEDICLVSSDEEESSVKNAYNIFVVNDDSNDTNNRILPDDEKEIQQEKLSFIGHCADSSEDPFSMCSEFEIKGPSENKSIVITTEDALSGTNVKTVLIEDIIEDRSKNVAIPEKNYGVKVNKPKTDINCVTMDSTKGSSGVKVNSIIEPCDPLNNSVVAGVDNNDSNSLKKRLAECLASFVKGNLLKTHSLVNSSKKQKPKILCLNEECHASVVSIINEVSKSTFSIDEYMSSASILNKKSCFNKTKKNVKSKLHAEDNQGNLSGIEGHKKENIKTCKKRGRKKGWRKHPLIKPNDALHTSNQQVANFSNNDEAEATRKDNEGVSGNTDVLSPSHNSTQHSFTLSDHAISDLKLNKVKRPYSLSDSKELANGNCILKENSSTMKPNSKKIRAKSTHLISNSQFLGAIVENICNNSSAERQKSNNFLSNKNESTTVSKNGFNEKSKNIVEESCYVINEDNSNKGLKAFVTFSQKINASKPTENNPVHFQEENNASTSLQNKADKSEMFQKIVNEGQLINSPELYAHHYKKVFDDNGEYLCMKMGDILLLNVKEARSCRSRIVAAQKFTSEQLKINEINLAKENYYEVVIKFKSSFVPLFSTLMQKIFNSAVQFQCNETLVLLLTTWFLKLYLRVTALGPEFLDCLKEIKVGVRTLIAVHHPLSKPIFHLLLLNESEFESKCCSVAQYMQFIYNNIQNGKEVDKNLNNIEKTVSIVEKGENVRSNESNLVDPKYTPLLEQLLKQNTGVVVTIKKNKIANELRPVPSTNNCNQPDGGRHLKKLQTTNIKEFVNIDLFRQQAQLNVPGGYHSSKDDDSYNSRYGAGDTRYNVPNDRSPNQTVTNPLGNNKKTGINCSTTQYRNRHEIQENNFGAVNPKTSESTAGVSQRTNHKPLEPQLSVYRNRPEINRRVKRKSADGDLHLAKKTITNKDDSFSNTLLGRGHAGYDPTAMVKNAQVNSTAYSQHPQSSSFHHLPPPSYSQFRRNCSHTSQQYYGNSLTNDMSLLRVPPPSAIEQQFAEEHQSFQNYSHNIKVCENNQYSQNRPESDSRDGNSSNAPIQQSTHSNGGNIAVTINNFNITNVFPSDSVIKHASTVGSQANSNTGLQKDMHQSNANIVKEHFPLETIHYV